jgi:hypothetical protein
MSFVRGVDESSRSPPIPMQSLINFELVPILMRVYARFDQEYPASSHQLSFGREMVN